MDDLSFARELPAFRSGAQMSGRAPREEDLAEIKSAILAKLALKRLKGPSGQHDFERDVAAQLRSQSGGVDHLSKLRAARGCKRSSPCRAEPTPGDSQDRPNYRQQASDRLLRRKVRDLLGRGPGGARRIGPLAKLAWFVACGEVAAIVLPRSASTGVRLPTEVRLRCRQRSRSWAGRRQTPERIQMISGEGAVVGESSVKKFGADRARNNANTMQGPMQSRWQSARRASPRTWTQFVRRAVSRVPVEQS
jgi:hypothetical protein